MKFLVLVLAVFLTLPAFAVDPRYCEGEPTRYADGTIKRSKKAIAEFRKDHACPSTGEHAGPCPGWAIDHVIPRAVGGCDTPFNMQYLPIEIKSCSGKLCKDRWERDVYARPQS